MDIRQLKYFVQIIESGSFSKASRQLFIVQPALSQQVARLEQEVGKPILIRSVRGVVPTENGLALYHHAKLVLRQLEDAVLVARQDYAQIQGKVTFGLAPSTSVMVGLTLLRHLKERYPGILLNIVVGQPGHLEERARQGQLDLAILFSTTAANELTHEPLLEEEVFVMLPMECDLVPPSAISLTLSQLAALPLVLSSTHHNIRRRVMLEFERAALEPEVVAEIDSIELVMRYVAEGGGVTIQPMAAKAVYSPPGGWRCLPIEDVLIRRQVFLYSLPIQTLSTCGSVVKTEIKKVVSTLVQDGTWEGTQLLTGSEG
jgi:LysR family transcriptional regulator, regulatory protein for tcuABC